MNKHTLNYHTRLHDWYRQHHIQQEKQQLQQQQDASFKATAEITGGSLTQDKLHFVDNWCAEVNRTLFKIKKKESPPLYRRCRFSASSYAGVSKAADPRRIRSAEVFTLSGHWAKQPKPVVNGGELLESSKTKSDKSHGNSKRGESDKQNTKVTDSTSGLTDLCVKNSTDCDANDKMVPRVNHDSLNLRANALILKQNGNRPLDGGLESPRGSLLNADRDVLHNYRKTSAQRRVKSAHPATMNSEYDAINERLAFINSKTIHPRSQKEMEIVKNAKNEEHLLSKRQKSASQKSHLTDGTLGTAEDDSRLARPVINVVVTDDIRKNPVPTFCNTCSGIYAGEIPPPSSPITCGNCVHGINIGMDDTKKADAVQIAKENEAMRKKHAENVKRLDEKIIRTEVEKKKVENRLTDVSIHYSAERDNMRQDPSKQRFALPNAFHDLEGDRNLSFDDDEGEYDASPRSIDRNGSECSDQDIRGENGTTIGEERVSKVVIKTDDIDDDENNNINNRSMSLSEDGPPDPMLLSDFFQRRGSRRKSISFTYKPTIGNVSTSNSLLHVLSIDDCKVNMRYSPHKVLEEHEVTDNAMVPFELINKEAFSMAKPGENTSKVAMRVSKGSSSVTSLQSSTANDATRANKKQYKILYDPEDLDFYRNNRPQSSSLAKAFQTLIHDRTIMQKIDKDGQKRNPRGVSTTFEGPGYRRIHAALRKHMGEVLQSQSAQLRNKYERQKSGCWKKPKNDGSLMSQSPSLSLSLDSLPVVKKGILKNTSNDRLNVSNNESMDG